MKIWLDDVRPAPAGYVLCRSVNEAKRTILTAVDNKEYISEINCDHDLGSYARFGGDGIRLLDWLEEQNFHFHVLCHSQNPVGIIKMNLIIRKNGW